MTTGDRIEHTSFVVERELSIGIRYGQSIKFRECDSLDCGESLGRANVEVFDGFVAVAEDSDASDFPVGEVVDVSGGGVLRDTADPAGCHDPDEREDVVASERLHAFKF